MAEQHSPKRPMQTCEYVVGGGRNCTHPPVDREYLGQFGPNAMFECQGCGGVVIVALPRQRNASEPHPANSDFPSGTKMSTGSLSGVVDRIITFSKRVFGATAVVVGGILGYQALAVMGTAPLITTINVVTGLLSVLLGAGVLYPPIASVWRAEPYSQLERDAMVVATIGVWVLSELAVQALT